MLPSTGDRRDVYRGLARKPEGKRPVGCSRHRCMFGNDRIALARDRNRLRALLKGIMHFRAPKNAGNFLTS
jgi:hypothetical protein